MGSRVLGTADTHHCLQLVVLVGCVITLGNAASSLLELLALGVESCCSQVLRCAAAVWSWSDPPFKAPGSAYSLAVSRVVFLESFKYKIVA